MLYKIYYNSTTNCNIYDKNTEIDSHVEVMGGDLPGPFKVHSTATKDPVLTKLMDTSVPWIEGVPFTNTAPKGGGGGKLL